MKKCFFTLTALVTLTYVNAQQNYADSLKQKLITAKEDSSKVNLYTDLAGEYLWSYPDTSLAYSLSGLQLARRLNFINGEIHLLNTMGEALAQKGNYPQALETQFKAMELARELNNPDEIIKCNVWIGSVYFLSKDYQKALNYFEKANSKDKLTLGVIGESYFHLNNLDSALFYIRKAYDLDVRSSSHWSVPYTYMARIYDKKGDPLLALDYYRQGNKVAIHRVDAINGYNGMASIFKKIGMEDSAIYYSKKVIVEGLNASIISPVIEASKQLTDIYKSKHFTDSAFKYQELMLASKDSLFGQEKVKQMQNLSFSEQLRQQEIITKQEEYQNKIKMSALLSALVVFLLIAFILFRNNQQKRKANTLLNKKNEEIQNALTELKSTQAQLIQSEKMASLGELTAGIAHEIQNPLNFVNNFSEVNKELLIEMNEEIEKGNFNEVKEISKDVIDNEEKISHHGKRADAIVKGMLQHSRSSSGVKEPTDINALADEYLRLAYHGLRAKDKSFNATMKTDFDESIGKINIIPQDIGRVILNLITNAFYAVTEKKKQQPDGYEPTVSVSTKKIGDKVEVKVKDNGNGIPQKVLDKIFEPFFTTKPTGQGTGLGLSLSYDIVKAHGGELNVQTKEGENTEFIIQLPTS